MKKLEAHAGLSMSKENGFTLVEVMVTMMLMIVVMFALYSVFDMSIRVFSFGNDKVEAVENARIGLSKMEREIRAAYPYDKPTGNDQLLATWTADEIKFGNDIETVNREVDVPAEEIVYTPSASGPPYTLLRRNPSNAMVADPVVEFLEADGLKFKYFESDGTTEVMPGGTEGDVAIVRITLSVDVDDRKQELTTDVALRNRND